MFVSRCHVMVTGCNKEWEYWSVGIRTQQGDEYRKKNTGIDVRKEQEQEQELELYFRQRY